MKKSWPYILGSIVGIGLVVGVKRFILTKGRGSRKAIKFVWL